MVTQEAALRTGLYQVGLLDLARRPFDGETLFQIKERLKAVENYHPIGRGMIGAVDCLLQSRQPRCVSVHGGEGYTPATAYFVELSSDDDRLGRTIIGHLGRLYSGSQGETWELHDSLAVKVSDDGEAYARLVVTSLICEEARVIWYCARQAIGFCLRSFDQDLRRRLGIGEEI